MSAALSLLFPFPTTLNKGSIVLTSFVKYFYRHACHLRTHRLCLDLWHRTVPNFCARLLPQSLCGSTLFPTVFHKGRSRNVRTRRRLSRGASFSHTSLGAFAVIAESTKTQTRKPIISMRCLYMILLMNILTLAGCKSETDNFNDKALAFAKDGKIDQEEFGQLISIVQKSSDRAFQQFKTEKYCWQLKGSLIFA